MDLCVCVCWINYQFLRANSLDVDDVVATLHAAGQWTRPVP